MTAHDKTVLLNTLMRFIEESISPQERRDITCEMCRRLTGFNIEKYLNNTHNNRKLKIKRGNSTENDNYTGVCGEITMDTDCNTIRVHDGSTPGGTTMARADTVTDMTGTDYVIEWQMPTPENNYTWYRKYKSGWIEQGGRSTDKAQFCVKMVDNLYVIVSMLSLQRTNGNNCYPEAITAYGFNIYQSGYNDGYGVSNNIPVQWTVIGRWC